MKQAERHALLARKLARAQFIAARLASMPFVRLLALMNSVAMGTATELSDLDFFVVMAPGRLWTARFLLLLRAKRLGLAKRPGATADQADFGWWIDEAALDLSPIALAPDPLLSRILATMIPLVDRGGVYEQFMRVNRESGIVNRTAVVSNPPAGQMRDLVVSAPRSEFLALLEMTLNTWFGEPIEWLLFRIQRWKVWSDPMAHRPHPLMNNGQRIDVVTTRQMLKLHHLDQRGKIRDLRRGSKQAPEGACRGRLRNHGTMKRSAPHRT